MTHAIVSLGGKQYRVREGEHLLVDRLPYAEGEAFHPDLLLMGGDGTVQIGEDELKGRQVTARVSAHVLGEKVVIGKHRRRTRYRRKNGYRSRLSRVEIESIGPAQPSRRAKKKAERMEGEE